MALNHWLNGPHAILTLRGSALFSVIGVFLAGFLLVLNRLFNRRSANTSPVVPALPYVLQFPPSRRHVLAGLSGFEKSLHNHEIPLAILKSQALPTTKAADLSRDNQYTPTGFSTQEIRRIGRFPDYSLLSGVRPPAPCAATWDISKAVFRPYRPFRWGYHQHMGRSHGND